MAKYKLSNVAKEDLIRIHHYGAKQFGIKQAGKYFDSFFTLNLLLKIQWDSNLLILLNPDINDVYAALIAYSTKLMKMSLKLWQSLGDKILINWFDLKGCQNTFIYNATNHMSERFVLFKIGLDCN